MDTDDQTFLMAMHPLAHPDAEEKLHQPEIVQDQASCAGQNQTVHHPAAKEVPNDHCAADCRSEWSLVAPWFAALGVRTGVSHADVCYSPLWADEAPRPVDQQDDDSHSHLLTFEHDSAGCVQHPSNCPRTVASSVQAERFDCLVLRVTHDPSQRCAQQMLASRLQLDLMIWGPVAGIWVWVWIGQGQPGVGCRS